MLAFCIGSNIDPEANIRRALVELRRKFGPLRCSRVYRSAAVGFPGPDFLNLAAVAETGAPVPEAVAWLKQLESRMGRKPGKPKFSSRPIDIDVFVPGAPDGAHGKLAIPHREVRESAFVLGPLAELLPKLKLAPDGPGLAQLWASRDKSRQALEPVAMELPAGA